MSLKDIVNDSMYNKIVEKAEEKGFICLWCMGDNTVHYYKLSEIAYIKYSDIEDCINNYVFISFKNGTSIEIDDNWQYRAIREVWENYILGE